MKISSQIKNQREANGWTQKDLAEKLQVSDKTISSWENDRTYPDVSMLTKLSDIFDVSLDEFIKGDAKMVQTIDSELRQKKVYKVILILLMVVFVVFGGFFKIYQYKNEMVDRINPLLKTEVGYATLPKTLTAGSKYKDILVFDDTFGDAAKLDFYGGLSPKGRNYAKVEHKGLYVSRIMFIPWKAIPISYRFNMTKEYEKPLPGGENPATYYNYKY